ncbi:MAG: PEGA domain-containing protein [Bacillota bacterium]
MAPRKTSEKAPPAPKESRGKKGSGSVIGAVLGVALVFGAFFLGAQYFTAKRSQTATVCATGITEEHLTVYRLPSGVLDKFDPEDLTSPTVDIPLAKQLTILNAAGKKVKAESFALDPASPKVVAIKINPQGDIWRIEELPGGFRVEGSAQVKGKREIVVDGTSYFIGGTVVLSGGGLTSNTGDDLEGTVDTGDIVQLTGHGDQVTVLDILQKAGTVAVSSNVDGAKVYVDGALRGKTPLVFTASPGERHVLVKAEGYTEKSFPVQVSSLTETKVEADLSEVTGTVSVASYPPGATVYVSGEPVGVTPVKLPLKPGPYEVQVMLQGYYPRKSQVLVVQDLNQPLSFTLVRKPGTPEPPAGGTGSGTGSGTGGGTGGASGSGDFPYTEKGVVLARTGASLFLGDRWTECVLTADAVAMDESGYVSVGAVEPGDTVTVYGDSSSAVKLVKIEKELSDNWPFEGFLVRTTDGYKVFGDNSILLIDIPDSLVVVDPSNRRKEAVASVPSGSRVKFYVDSGGQAVWAEYVWKAGVSAEGTVSSVSGAVFRIAPSWEDLHMSTATIVYVDTHRRESDDVRIGDVAVAAGPHSRDVRFIWVTNRLKGLLEVQTVALSTGAKGTKMLQEYGDIALDGHNIQAGNDVEFYYAGDKGTVSASELQYGDRVRLWLDKDRRIVSGEILVMNDVRFSGVYLGEADGFHYFSGFNKYAAASDLIITGLAEGEELTPGSRVLVAGDGETINYIEVQAEVTYDTTVTGTVLMNEGGSIEIRKGTGRAYSYEYAKDAWFADWELCQDGPVSTLFPGDKVTLRLGYDTDDVVYAERTYSAPFKLQGTVEAISFSKRTMVIADKNTRKTITITSKATLVKDGGIENLFAFEVGDKVKVSGQDKAHVDMVVATE